MFDEIPTFFAFGIHIQLSNLNFRILLTPEVEYTIDEIFLIEDVRGLHIQERDMLSR